MIWSRYNYLFESAKYGRLLYNALSNSFAQIGDEVVGEVEAIRSNPDGFDYSRNPALYLQLLAMKVLLADDEERTLVNILRYEDLRRRYDNKRLDLTIAPTLFCNFACTYCYEENRRPVHMDDETEDALLDFIQRFGALRYINLTWFGGEPLLRFERIASISRRIQALQIPSIASIVTNGYLLEPAISAQLAGLRIREVQVSLDGDEATHDRRRITAGGGETYRRIMGNLDALMSCWDGELSIRVNLDQSNRDSYHLVHRALTERFAGKRVRVYPGFIEFGSAADLGCQLNRDDVALFQIEQYRRHGIAALSFYPSPQMTGCIATRQNGFTIGPTGELYRCWHDMGVPEKVFGSIRRNDAWNMAMVTEYMVATDMFDDPECRQCFFLPVCGGGCPRVRCLKFAGAGAAADQTYSCFAFRDRLPEMLEIYYEMKQREAAATPAC